MPAEHRTSVRLIAGLMCLLPVTASGQPNRLTGPINARRSAVLSGTRRPDLQRFSDQGPIDAEFRLSQITLMFKRSNSQQSALEQLLADQQEPTSPNYHVWLEPGEFGDRFGLSPTDLQRVTAWLQATGFSIDYVPVSRGWVVFSGTARQIRDTFATEIRRYRADGEDHFANTTDISVPSDLQPLVLGVQGLDDFRSKPASLRLHDSPDFTSSSGAHYLSPDDYATIYDLKPLYSAGYDGTGQTIVVVGRCHIGLGDVQQFRFTFGLPSNDPQLLLVPGSADPGTNSADDCGEAYLDVEWAGAIARKAKIVLVFGTDDTLAVFYAVGQNLAPVISQSFGSCDTGKPLSYLSALRALAQQANSQGITWLASSGDTGAADCDAQGTPPPATHGLAVNVPAGVPEVTAVGGTQFNDGGGSYWASTNSATGASALSYIPEIAWNETPSINELAASGGGISSYYAEPTWQSAIGVSSLGMRAVPDVALAAAVSHDSYIVLFDGQLQPVGGTSAATPSFAGMIALLNQNQATRQGNINPNLYRLFQSTPSAFHDITAGNNIVPCVGTADCINGFLGYNAEQGYDLVTGLGSVDANVLITHWPNNSGGQITVLDKLTSTTTGLANGVCSTPPVVSSFSVSSPQVWLYFDVTGARAGDSVQMKFLRPDGVLYANQSASVSTPGANGYQCFSYALPVAGTPAASYPGTWVIQTFWNQSSAPMFTLRFSLVGLPPMITSISPSSVVAGSGGFTMTVNGSNFTSAAVVLWNGTALPTTFVSSTQLTASVAANLVASAGMVSISVSSGGQQSGAATFTITAAGGTISLKNQRVTTQAPPATGCVVPPSVTSFLTTSNTVYLYFEATVTANDLLSNDWLAPDGSIVNPGSWTKTTGSFCFANAKPLTISNLPSRQLGSWLARIYDNGSVVAIIPFTVTGTGGSPSSRLMYFIPVPLCHVVDTRIGQGTAGEFGPPSMSAGQTRTLHPSAGACTGIPATAKAYSLNVTAASRPGGSLSYVTL